MLNHEKPTFDPQFLEAQFDSAIAYMESQNCEGYRVKNHQGWYIEFKKVEKK